jgi:hypothetical protein
MLSWGPTQGTAQSFAQARKLSNVQESRSGRLIVLLQIAILRGRRLRLAGKLCEGGRGASRLASGCFLQARCPSREPSETGLPLFVGRAEYMDIWELGVVNTNTLLHVKIEGYRGTDPPSRNLEFRERWKIGGFLVRL